ncbi:MAG: DinB family protein [Gemmatimonadota bacterium]|nr:DinB family protein [Gemmatimonadota bacterium]
MSQSPEARAEIARFQLHSTLAALDAVDRAFAAIPDDRLDEEPVADQMAAGTMVAHIYQAVAMCARAFVLGRMEEGDMDGLTDPEEGWKKEAIVALSKAARAELASALAAVSPDSAERTIDFYFGFSASGLDTAWLGHSELLHHRGQLVTFMRIMGLEPPNIYEGHPL